VNVRNSAGVMCRLFHTHRHTKTHTCEYALTDMKTHTSTHMNSKLTNYILFKELKPNFSREWGQK